VIGVSDVGVVVRAERSTTMAAEKDDAPSPSTDVSASPRRLRADAPKTRSSASYSDRSGHILRSCRFVVIVTDDLCGATAWTLDPASGTWSANALGAVSVQAWTRPGRC
jgi:hypothetical protein